MCKEMPVIPVNREVDKKRMMGKNMFLYEENALSRNRRIHSRVGVMNQWNKSVLIKFQNREQVLCNVKI
jgi:hypothetical protein